MTNWQKVENLNLYDFIERESKETANVEDLTARFLRRLQGHLPATDETVTAIRAHLANVTGSTPHLANITASLLPCK